MQLEKKFDLDTSKMIIKLNETEKAIKCLCEDSKKALNNKDKVIQTLMNQSEKLEKKIESDQVMILELVKERDELRHSVEREILGRTTLDKEYESRCIEKEKAIEHITTEIVQLKKINDEKTKGNLFTKLV